MLRRGCIAAGLAVAAVGLFLYAQDAPKRADAPGAAARADLKPLVQAFKAAFKARDAAAVANLWTSEAELTTASGDTVRGREEIQAAYAELFKAKPNMTTEVEHGEVRALGPTAAVVEGVLKITTPGEPEPDVTLFKAWVVKEPDGWRFAAVESHEADPEPVTLADLEWLVGDWAGTGEDGSALKATYAWQEGNQFLRCTYSSTTEGKALGGLQVIGVSPDGQLHAWLFDNSGTTGESEWTRDGDRWLLQATGTLPDGSTSEATNVLARLGPDEFTWQSIHRKSNGEPVPNGRPVKMKRVAGK